MDSMVLADTIGVILAPVILFVWATVRYRSNVRAARDPKGKILEKEGQKKLGEIYCVAGLRKLVLTEDKLLYLPLNEKRIKFACNLSDIQSVNVTMKRVKPESYTIAVQCAASGGSVSQKKWVVANEKFIHYPVPWLGGFIKQRFVRMTVGEFADMVRVRSGVQLA